MNGEVLCDFNLVVAVAIIEWVTMLYMMHMSARRDLM